MEWETGQARGWVNVVKWIQSRDWTGQGWVNVIQGNWSETREAKVGKYMYSQKDWTGQGWVNVVQRSGKLEKSGMGTCNQKEWETRQAMSELS
jgi:hypothetical protein